MEKTLMAYKEKYPIGSQWKTRAGSRAIVTKYDDDSEYQIVIWVDDIRHIGRINTILASGESSGLGQEPDDLIAPWKDQVKGELWINLYHDPDSNMYLIRHGTYLSKADADAELKKVGLKLFKQIGPIEWEYEG